MEEHQVAWAMQHDWAIRTRVLDGKLGVRVADATAQYGFLDFYSLSELRAWAGY